MVLRAQVRQGSAGTPSAEDAKHRADMVLRLKRVEGQLRAVQRMIEAGEDCEPIAHQLAASRKALDRAFFELIACAMQQAVNGRPADPRVAARAQHIAELLSRFA